MKHRVQNIGAIGESTVTTELLWQGWAPANLNAIISNAPNVDILAAKDNKTIALQVKTSGPNSKSMLRLGYSGSEAIFNTKNGPQADFIIFVRLFGSSNYECYIVPVNEAEKVARKTAEDWLDTPMRSGLKREPNFERCIRFELNKNRPAVSNYKEKWQHYLNAWYLLEV